METYNGHVRTPADAVILFEACRVGLLPRVQRRLSEKERQQIKSGSVFVWDEREAGMKRWTDGKSWSASRVSGSFLTYREMEGKRGGSQPASSTPAKRPAPRTPEDSVNGDSEDAEGPDGPDGYRYKLDGLMKQSFSITTSTGQHLHLISYYSRSTSSNLKTPTNDPSLRHIHPPKGMYPESSVNENQGVPAVTQGPMTGSFHAGPPGSASPYARGGAGPQIPVMFAPFPGPPTPPYHQAYYIQAHHIPYNASPIFYAPQPGYPPFPQGYPPHLVPPPPHQMPPHYLSPQPPPPPRAPSGPDLAPPHTHHPGHQSQSPHLHHPGHQSPHHPAPQHSPHHQPHQALPQTKPTQHTSPPEQGPVLPALNPINQQPPHQSPETRDRDRDRDSLNVPDSNNGAPHQNRAPTPSRNIPSLQTLLNSSNANDYSPEGSSTTTTNNHSHTHNSNSNSNNAPRSTSRSGSRSGSRSPTSTSNPQYPPREVPATTSTYHRMTDAQAVAKLNSGFANA